MNDNANWLAARIVYGNFFWQYKRGLRWPGHLVVEARSDKNLAPFAFQSETGRLFLSSAKGLVSCVYGTRPQVGRATRVKTQNVF